mmetsp:Transcript_32986/g.78400  ORF Transcript_32986/g.78400 Transcript_32986/m.78400 type:complete len:211 (+) Transcript_32986:219-851(+)
MGRSGAAVGLREACSAKTRRSCPCGRTGEDTNSSTCRFSARATRARPAPWPTGMATPRARPQTGHAGRRCPSRRWQVCVARPSRGQCTRCASCQTAQPSSQMESKLRRRIRHRLAAPAVAGPVGLQISGLGLRSRRCRNRSQRDRERPWRLRKKLLRRVRRWQQAWPQRTYRTRGSHRARTVVLWPHPPRHRGQAARGAGEEDCHRHRSQ